jgi:pyridoxal phosphate-dependent aminotransferase EpsN
MNKRIYLSPPDLTGNEFEYVQDALASNWVSSVGTHLEVLVADLKKITRSAYILPVNSGTSAIHLALLALNVSEGDVVFCPTFTFAATVFPVCYQKAIPVFIDCETETWNMDPVLLEQAIVDSLQQNKKTKAIILAHIYGFPAQLDKIILLAQKYNLAIIEDAAESLGSTCKDRALGTFTAIGITSFNGNKITTGGNGGAIFTADVELYNRMNLLSNQAKEDNNFYEHLHVGYNYRMCNVNAAIIRGQLEQLEQKVAKKHLIRDWYAKHLPSIITVKYSTIGMDNAWLTCILVPDNRSPAAIQQVLADNNIESRRLWNPMHCQPIFKDATFYSNGTADHIFSRGLSLPSGTQLTEADVIHIVGIIKSCL